MRLVRFAAASAVICALLGLAGEPDARLGPSGSGQATGGAAGLTVADREPIPIQVRPAPGTPGKDPEGGAPIGLDPPATARARPGDRVIEIRHDGTATDIVEAAIVAAGGRVHGPAGPRALEATVPSAAIEALTGTPHVTAVTTPAISAPTESASSRAVTGSEVGYTRANLWHQAGIHGAGVKVGIIDSFSGSIWNTAAAAGDVPSGPAGTFCRRAGSSCNVWAGIEHGVGVAEVIHEMAPQAQLYVATIGTPADFQAAINYFASQGVDVVTRSETAEYDGPGNGTGPNADVVSSAVAQGMVYLNAAGNSGGSVSASRAGSYWRGSWSDTDGDGFLNFNGTDELLRTRCWYFNGLRWNDWGPAASRTDYDVRLYSDSGTYMGAGETYQQSGALPLERLNHVPCTQGSYVNIAISLFDAGSGTAGDTLEIMVNGIGVEYWQNPYAAAAPMADSANPGALTVGAIDPASGVTIAPYSSHGPTNDGRTKPDLSAVSCLATTAYGPSRCFDGTSAATPVVAGEAALVISSGRATTPVGVASYLRSAAAVFDRGVAGPDSVYGQGETILPYRSSTPWTSWTAAIHRQHRDLIGRSATGSEITTWTRRFAIEGQSPAALVASLRRSSDNLGNVDPVARLYWAYFLRIPDAGGLNHWIGRRRAGTSIAAISSSFAGSAEFRARYGNLTNTQFVNLIYQNILGRPGEPSGVAFWVGELNSGRKTRGQVMVGFSESAEYRSAMRGKVDVAAMATLMLKRAPTTGEVDTQAVGTTEGIAAWVLGHSGYTES